MSTITSTTTTLTTPSRIKSTVMAANTSLASDHGACVHLASRPPEEVTKMIKRYRKVVLWSCVDVMKFRTGKDRKRPLPACATCEAPLQKPFYCLICRATFCHQRHSPSSSSGGSGGGSGKTSHMIEHAKSSGHPFALNIRQGSIWCHDCDDYIYPDTFEAVLTDCKRQAEEKLDVSTVAGKRRLPVKPWKPNETETELMSNMDRLRCHGLRPLLNLSQTCFLSSILQSFIHNPLLRSYFLSDKHNRRLCALRRRKRKMDEEEEADEGVSIAGASEVGGVAECMCCEMDAAFSELCSGDVTPFGPTSMLGAIWKSSEELAGHQQQDAQSFFLAALNQIHSNTENSVERPGECPCIAHQTFAGSLMSTVTCSRCSSSTRTEDPFLDVSLELKGGAMMDKVTAPPSLTAPLTLLDCLRRYTSKEALSAKAYACDKCGPDAHAEATKQLSIKRLPATLAFQLKRFEHKSAQSSKVETMVRFPVKLDMKPFMSETLNGDKKRLPSLAKDMYTYDLIAVVTHEGKLENGHYWADVRSGTEWFRCDDDKITATTLSAVLAQRAYQLFYLRRSVSYQE